MIFLSSPYTGTEEQQEQRYLDACACCAALFSKGLFLVSPIVHWHEVARRFTLKGDAEYYKAYNHSLLQVCTSLYVLQIDGWRESKGVALELSWARDLKKNIKAVIPNGYKYEIRNWE